MSYRLKYTQTFEKQIEKIKEKYRLVYRVDEEEKEVRLVAFGHRKEIYKLMMFLRAE